MKSQEINCDVVVIGGGISGFCAALATARNGAKTCLIHNRPVLGGNASSEIRVPVHGAACHHPYGRETGIVGEAMRAERASNHQRAFGNGWTNSVFDMALYDLAVRQENLTLHLNTDVHDVELSDGRRGRERFSEWPAATAESGYLRRPPCHDGLSIRSIHARVQNAEVELRVQGRIFIDATGDALAAHLAGCEWRMGSESRTETGELHAPERSSTDTMGSSIHIRCIDTGRPAPFRAPDWAMHYEDADFFYKGGRYPNEPKGGFWWIEIGVPWDTISENETIRHELTRHALGVWDWMKNRDPAMRERCRNFALEFIGQVPGKRESRRVMGLHLLDENELQRREPFPDEIAYGGWFIDLHSPGGLLADHSEPACIMGHDDAVRDVALKYLGPYSIPLRSLISKDVPNLMMAGRDISATHAALGSVRVMGTCGLMGQGAGTAAAVAIARGLPLRELVETAMPEVQRHLLRDGCFLPSAGKTERLDNTRAQASSTLLFEGLGAWDKDADTQLLDTVWQLSLGKATPLDKSPCNWFPLAGGRLDTLSPHLITEKGGCGVIRLRRVADLWVYERDPGGLVWESAFELPAGFDGLHSFATDLIGLEAGYYRLEIEGDLSIAWRMSGRHPWGVTGGNTIGSGRYHWNRLPGEHAFHLHPKQSIYGPEQVLSGVGRPQEQSNAWLADGPLPQWVGVTFGQPRELSEVILDFPDQLVLELHWESPFYVPPHIARRYRVEGLVDGTWTCLVRVEDNQAPRARHKLAPVTASALRVVIEETHGGAAGLSVLRVG